MLTVSTLRTMTEAESNQIDNLVISFANAANDFCGLADDLDSYAVASVVLAFTGVVSRLTLDDIGKLYVDYLAVAKLFRDQVEAAKYTVTGFGDNTEPRLTKAVKLLEKLEDKLILLEEALNAKAIRLDS